MSRWALLVLLFSPLLVIAGLRVYSHYEIDQAIIMVVAGIIILCIIKVGVTARNIIKKAENTKNICIESKKEKIDHSQIILTIIPYVIMVAAESTVLAVAACVMVFWVAGISYVRGNDTGIITPMLRACGFRIFQIKYFEMHNTENTKKMLLLARHAPMNGAEMRVIEMFNGMYVQKVF